MYKRGLVAMSADPIHKGHLNLILRAKQQCETLFVLVSSNDEKAGSYAFTLDERLEMTKRAVRQVGGEDIVVISPPTFVLADTYLHYNCDVLFRGIRNVIDFEYEKTQMQYHKMVYSGLNVEYLHADPELQHISSSIVKTFAKHHIDISEHVLPFVKVNVESRVAKQVKIGVTGQMATGKSWVCDMLVKRLHNQTGHPTRAIKLDEIIREIYEDKIPGAEGMRLKIDGFVQKKGFSSVLSDGIVNRKALGEILFHDKFTDDDRKYISELTKPLIQMQYRRMLTGYTGIVIFEWAQLAEMNMGHWVNNNVVVVDSPDREALIKLRGIPADTVKSRHAHQWSSEKKAEVLALKAMSDQQGQVISFSNKLSTSRGGASDENFNKLVQEIVARIPQVLHPCVLR